MTNTQGRHVSLFLVEGTFGGIVTAEIMNWTGHVLKGQRSQLSAICKRDEAKRPGVYILLGEDENGPLAYIGQTDCIADRLRQHNTNGSMDFWNEVVFVTSKDSNLTSAHVRYLEAQLYQRATELKRMRLKNGNEPSGGAKLPEADKSDMDCFIQQMLILLPVLGVEFLRGRYTADARQEIHETSTAAAQNNSTVFKLEVPRNKVMAKSQIIDGEFTVLADSIIASAVTAKEGTKAASSSTYNSLNALFQQYRDDGTIVPDPDDDHIAKLTRDVQFSSPSSAAAFVKGNVTANGRIDWRTEDGKTYAAWESTNV